MIGFKITGIALLIGLGTLVIKTGQRQVSKSQSHWEKTSPDTVPGPALFASDDVLPVTLSGPVYELLNDREDNAGSHAIEFSYRNADSSEVRLKVEMKTRGHFRRLKENCVYPPLSISFQASRALAGSIFHDQRKIKLVMPCRGDEYIVREWLIYQLYRQITPYGFRSRIVRVTLRDEKGKKNPDPFYGILLEEEWQMAGRNNMLSLERKIRPEQTQQEAFLTMAVFQYLIGNTDWSIQYLQNIKLLASDSLAPPVPVPYDFDHAGLVGAPYAKPAEELQLASIRVRRYRGYCMPDLKPLQPVLDKFRQRREQLMDVYRNCPLITDKYRAQSLKYLEDFFTIINTEKDFRKEFSYPCDRNGTGNVVIRGLKED